MKNLIKLTILGFLILSTILHSCKKEKEEVPIVTTSAVTNIKDITATSGGIITDEGSGAIIERGVCWSTENTPTLEDNKTKDSSGTGTFTSNLTQLTPNTKYYLTAYATNNIGTGYGSILSFMTQAVINEYIEITIVSPTSNLIDGELTNFSIDGNYILSSHDSGIIMIGFNNGSLINSYIMLSNKNIIIENGEGQFHFDVTAKVKNWGSEGAFSVLVTISPNPLPTGSYTPYAVDIFEIIPKTN
jgi:hypothetical protein